MKEHLIKRKDQGQGRMKHQDSEDSEIKKRFFKENLIHKRNQDQDFSTYQVLRWTYQLGLRDHIPDCQKDEESRKSALRSNEEDWQV